MSKNPYANMKVRKFINGVPLEELNEEELKAFRKWNTQVAERVISKHVNNMIENGATKQEIINFLKPGLEN